MNGATERARERLGLSRRIESYRLMLTSVEDRQAKVALQVSMSKLFDGKPRKTDHAM